MPSATCPPSSANFSVTDPSTCRQDPGDALKMTSSRGLASRADGWGGRQWARMSCWPPSSAPPSLIAIGRSAAIWCRKTRDRCHVTCGQATHPYPGLGDLHSSWEQNEPVREELRKLLWCSWGRHRPLIRCWVRSEHGLDYSGPVIQLIDNPLARLDKLVLLK